MAITTSSERELLAVLLVAEADVGARATCRMVSRTWPSADHRLVLLAQLHRAGQRRTLEGEHAVAAVVPDAKRRSLAAQWFVRGVEQGVFLQAAAAERRGADRHDARPRVVGGVEPEFDLAFEGHTQKGRVVRPALTVMHARRGRRYCFRTVTNVSCPLRRMSMNAVLPSATWPSRRLASAGEVTSRRFRSASAATASRADDDPRR